MPEVTIYPDKTSLARAAADHFSDAAARAIDQGGRFSAALAGGSTPRAAYALLAEEDLDWGRIHLFWGDERCVLPDHRDSNYRMLSETLLEHVSIPAGNVHRILGELGPENAADDYERELRSFFGHDPDPQAEIEALRSFDLVLLGMGTDGHTASLFPRSPALDVQERWATAVAHDQPPAPLVDRVSLTLAAINAADQVTFLVTGVNKAERLQQALSAPVSPEAALPAQLVAPTSGRLLWMVDEEAAGV
jgi:6-phosphogluconolactonase